MHEPPAPVWRNRVLPTARVLAVVLAAATALTAPDPVAALTMVGPAAVWALVAFAIRPAREFHHAWIVDLAVVLGARVALPAEATDSIILLIAGPIGAGVVGGVPGVVFTGVASAVSFVAAPLAPGASVADACVSAVLMAGIAALGYGVKRKAESTTERIHRAEADIARLHSVLATVLQTDERAVIVWDADGQVVEANAAARRLFADHVGPVASDDPTSALRTQALQTGHPVENVVLRPAPPHHRWLSASAHPADVGGARWIVTIHADITDEINTVSELKEASERDPLTGIGNRRSLERTITALEATPGNVGIALLDLDGFKTINDQHGHAVGDEVLQEVGNRLLAVSRSGDQATRLGGDEFVLVIPGATPETLRCVVERIDRTIGAPYVTSHGLITVGCSVGTTIGDTLQIRQLLRRADDEMYARKRGVRRPSSPALDDARD